MPTPDNDALRKNELAYGAAARLMSLKKIPVKAYELYADTCIAVHANPDLFPKIEIAESQNGLPQITLDGDNLLNRQKLQSRGSDIGLVHESLGKVFLQMLSGERPTLAAAKPAIHTLAAEHVLSTRAVWRLQSFGQAPDAYKSIYNFIDNLPTFHGSHPLSKTKANVPDEIQDQDYQGKPLSQNPSFITAEIEGAFLNRDKNSIDWEMAKETFPKTAAAFAAVAGNLKGFDHKGDTAAIAKLNAARTAAENKATSDVPHSKHDNPFPDQIVPESHGQEKDKLNILAITRLQSFPGFSDCPDYYKHIYKILDDSKTYKFGPKEEGFSNPLSDIPVASDSKMPADSIVGARFDKILHEQKLDKDPKFVILQVEAAYLERGKDASAWALAKRTYPETANDFSAAAPGVKSSNRTEMEYILDAARKKAEPAAKTDLAKTKSFAMLKGERKSPAGTAVAFNDTASRQMARVNLAHAASLAIPAPVITQDATQKPTHKRGLNGAMA